MRVFVCGFGDFQVAIPMHSVSSLALHAGNPSNTGNPSNMDRNNYVSLPLLFKLPSENIKHSIILKNLDVEDEDAVDNTAENKTILLIPEVECEMEIPDEEMHLIPKVLSSTHFFIFFRGIKFDQSGGGPILLLNTDQLIRSEQKETAL